MKITELGIAAFRNLKEQTILPGGGSNVIYGENAQGKTNLLEAIWLFTGGKSFRGAKENEMIPFDGQFAKLSMQFESEGRPQQMDLRLTQTKEMFLNGAKCRTAADVVGKLGCVVFSPVHLNLVKDGPNLRRRFMDGAICQMKPSYISSMNQYRRALLSRGALLKDCQYHAELLDTLDIWDVQLAGLAERIVEKRKEFIEKLTPVAEEAYAGICGGKEQLSIRYESTVPEGDYRQEFLKQLRENRALDLKNRTTSAGPHRDDLVLCINGNSARSYGSQGQQRSCVLALKLAEAALMEQLFSEKPVILLDDVLSELDKNRQQYVLNKLSGFQVFITCCEKEHFEGLENGVLFFMQDGQLTRG